MTKTTIVELPPREKYVNPAFVPILDNRDRYLVLYGGRNSSKSVSVARKLIYRALNEDNFRYILVKKTYESIKDSQYQTLKDSVYDLGLEDLFHFKTSPLEIEVKENGNKFIARGLDKPEKLKSIKDPTGAWYEEGNQITEEDFITVTTSIRGECDYLQEIFSFNPEVPKEVLEKEDFWVWDRFFKNNPHELSFKGQTEVEVTYQGKKQKINQKFTVHHSTIEDNEYATPEMYADLEVLALTDPYYYDVFAKGLWGRRKIGGEYYHNWDRPRHMADVPYMEDLASHLCFDFNVWPYITCVVVQYEQLEGRVRIRIPKEYCLAHPFNTTEELCRAWEADYGHLKNAVFYYGDSTGKNKIPGLGDVSNYSLIEDYLIKHLNYNSDRVLRRNPNPLKRRDLVNKILSGKLNVDILVDRSCKNTIKDFETLKLGPEGKFKEKYKDKELGITYEIVGHTSDALEGFISYIFEDLL